MAWIHRELRVDLTDPARLKQACSQCITERLQAHGGIQDVHLHHDDDTLTIRLSYDPNLLTLAELDRELAKANSCLCQDIGYIVVPLQGMVSSRSEQLVNTVLKKLPGVTATASYPSQSLRLEFDRRMCPMPELVRQLDQLGMCADFSRAASGREAELPPEAAIARPGTARKPLIEQATDLLGRINPELALATVAGIFLVAGWIVHAKDGPQWLRLSLLTVAYAAAARYTGIEAFHTLKSFHFNIDVLMFAAAFGAASIGEFEEGALLLVLFALGNTGEHLALERARNAIRALSKLAPETATVVDPAGQQRTVRVEALALADRIIVRPFERVPADGAVVEGASAVDQAPITGESIPVEKSVGDHVFAGTINGEGRLVVSVSRLASQSTLAKIVKLVEEAQTTKSPTQLFADKVEKFYVPAVLILTAALIIVPPLLGFPHRRPRVDQSIWAGWFYQAMGFLTAASPCALAIGTPAAVLCGIARAARMGVLLKGGVHLENLARVRAIAFDKTGTLTLGQPTVTDVVSFSSPSPLQAEGRGEGRSVDVVMDANADRLLALAASVERESTHPLASAIVAEAEARSIALLTPSSVEQIAGQGVSGTIDGRRIAAGQLGMLNAEDRADQRIADTIDRLTRLGRTTVAITIDGRCAGLIALSDRPRENAAAVLRQLKAMGIRKTMMLTGDHPEAAAAIARIVEVDEVHASLLPQQKLTLMQETQREFGHVAMVGDGVNDAPALAYASVGIAMGGASADVAMETADVVLMSSDLQRLPDAIGLSRAARLIIAQNLIIALGVIAVMAPIAALGFAALGVAVAFHEGSTVLVVLNSLRLLAYRPRRW